MNGPSRTASVFGCCCQCAPTHWPGRYLAVVDSAEPSRLGTGRALAGEAAGRRRRSDNAAAVLKGYSITSVLAKPWAAIEVASKP